MRLIVALALMLLASLPAASQQQPGSPASLGTQVSVTTTATIVAIARANRLAATIQNHGTTAAYCSGTSAVTTGTGFRLPGVDGASITIPTRGVVYCIVGAGSQTVSVLESY